MRCRKESRRAETSCLQTVLQCISVMSMQRSKNVTTREGYRHKRDKFKGQNPGSPFAAKPLGHEENIPLPGELMTLGFNLHRAPSLREGFEGSAKWFESPHLSDDLPRFCWKNFWYGIKCPSGVITDTTMSRGPESFLCIATTLKLGMQRRPWVHHRVKLVRNGNCLVNCKLNCVRPCNKSSLCLIGINNMIQVEKWESGLWS